MRVLIWLSIGLDRRSPSFHLIESIVEKLLEKKCTICILQKDTGGTFDYTKLKKENVEFINIKCNSAKKSNLISRYINDLVYVLKCKKILKNNKNFDRFFIQSSNVSGIQSSILRKMKKDANITYNVQDLFPNNLMYLKNINRNNLIYKIINNIQKKVYINSNKIITISDDIEEELISMGIPSEKIEMVYNWSYQDDIFNNSTRNSEIDKIFDKTKFNVVYAGNIGVMQNVDVIINAAKIIQRQDKDIEFIIIGEGVAKCKLKNKVDEQKINNVRFYDMFPSEYAPYIYMNADINVIPLKKNIFKTALPSKTATCLACQKPIIFCLGRDSKFGKKIEKNTKCPCIESDDYESLSNNIINIKNQKTKVNTKNYFYKLFSKTKNSKLYADIILK